VDWRIKGAIQKALEITPFGDRIHAALHQKRGMRFDDECDLKVDDWRIMMDHLRASHVGVAGATVVEIGTGWYPTFPVCLLLAGAARVHTFDITRNLNPKLVRALVARLRIHVETIARAAGRPPHAIEARRRLLAEGLARSQPGGAVFHSVNCGDHYAYFDPSISQLNYLQFSDLEWQRWNNKFHYQNRLRAKEFPALAARAGFVIEIDASNVHPQRLAELSSIRVDPGFSRYTREELALTNVDFVARKR
jgi:hypothetical protein